MSGHSKWATTKRQKAVVDAKRGALFTKIGNQIAIAARGGTDPAMNPSLAMVLEKARQANMPKANIERAIARVADKNATALIEETYEAYGPAGVGIIIEVATVGKRAKINAFIDNKPAGSLDAIGTVNFLEANPDAVIYPSKACTGVENTMLYDNQASDTQKIRAHELHAATINYSPIKHANWLKDLKLQLQDRFLWDSEGAYNYAGFEIPPTGDSIPKITEW